MKQYKFELIVNEQDDEMWEEFTKEGKSGCDEVLNVIKDELLNYDIEVRLTGYTDK